MIGSLETVLSSTAERLELFLVKGLAPERTRLLPLGRLLPLYIKFSKYGKKTYKRKPPKREKDETEKNEIIFRSLFNCKSSKSSLYSGNTIF